MKSDIYTIKTNLFLFCKNCGYEQSIYETTQECDICGGKDNFYCIIDEHKFKIQDISSFNKGKSKLYFKLDPNKEFKFENEKTDVKELIGYMVITQKKDIKLILDPAFNGLLKNEALLQEKWKAKNIDRYDPKATVFPFYADYFIFRKKNYLKNLYSCYGRLYIEDKNLKLQKKHGKYFKITLNGSIYDAVEAKEAGSNFICKKEDKYIVCDVSLKQLNGLLCEEVKYISEYNILLCRIKNKYSLYDTYGKKLTQKDYKQLEFLGNGLFDTGIEIINYNGDILLSNEFDTVKAFTSDTLLLKKDKKFGLFSVRQNKIILNCEYLKIKEVVAGSNIYAIYKDIILFELYDGNSNKKISEELFDGYLINNHFIDLIGWNKNGFYNWHNGYLFLEKDILFSKWNIDGIRSYHYAKGNSKYGLINNMGEKFTNTKYNDIYPNGYQIVCKGIFFKTKYEVIDNKIYKLSKKNPKLFKINPKHFSKIVIAGAIFLFLMIEMIDLRYYYMPKLFSDSSKQNEKRHTIKTNKKLEFQKFHVGSRKKYTYNEAVEYCQRLDNGKWQLPSSKQLLSLMTEKRSYGGIYLPKQMAWVDYKSKENSWYWTSDSINKKYALIINYYKKIGILKSKKSNKYLVRCIKK